MSSTAILSPDVEAARVEGYAAAKRGESFRACPYAYLTRERTAWLDGYRVATHPVIPSANKADFRTAVG